MTKSYICHACGGRLEQAEQHKGFMLRGYSVHEHCLRQFEAMEPCGHFAQRADTAEEIAARGLLVTRMVAIATRGKHNGRFLNDSERILAEMMVELHQLRALNARQSSLLYEDWCRLSQLFNQSANLLVLQDRNINEFLKRGIQNALEYAP